MKLKFNKTGEGDISALILDDTKQESFTYIKMMLLFLRGKLSNVNMGKE